MEHYPGKWKGWGMTEEEIMEELARMAMDWALGEEPVGPRRGLLPRRGRSPRVDDGKRWHAP